MADVKWIKFATGFPNSKKLKQIRKLPDGDSIALFWVFLICLAGDINEDGMIYLTPEVPYTEEMLANEFDIDINTIRLGLKTFQTYGMIQIIDDIICLSSWEKWQATDSLANIREKTRLRVAKHREKQKLLASNVTGNVTVTQCNAIEEDIERDIDKDIDINKIHSASDNAPSKKDISDFFEKIWLLYPCKKGKGQVSDSKKKTLFNIGLEEMTRAIERYKDDLSKEDWRKPQNGSTFFNSGYVDYLDANYTPLEPKKTTAKQNGYNQAPQRQYDMEAMERMLLNQNKPKEHNDP